MCSHVFTKVTEFLLCARPWEENNEWNRQVSCILRAYHPLEELALIRYHTKAYLHDAGMKKHSKQRELLKGGASFQGQFLASLSRN